MELNLPEKRLFVGPANIWKRILSLVIDMLILDFFVIGFFRDILLQIGGSSGSIIETMRALEQSESTVRILSMIFMIIVMLSIAYFALLQYATGQTIGAMLLNLHVVHQTGEKEFIRPNLIQCIVRNLFLVPFIPFILLWIADPVYMAFTKNGQRLTEWLSQTRVVERFEI
ncbi:RDD family protein [Candidatus Woesearchaeota archaeon]|nr:RDD family protein [Candidatus Woesearchaeota archaeon]